jgi:hypothetical protein
VLSNDVSLRGIWLCIQPDDAFLREHERSCLAFHLNVLQSSLRDALKEVKLFGKGIKAAARSAKLGGLECITEEFSLGGTKRMFMWLGPRNIDSPTIANQLSSFELEDELEDEQGDEPDDSYYSFCRRAASLEFAQRPRPWSPASLNIRGIDTVQCKVGLQLAFDGNLVWPVEGAHYPKQTQAAHFDIEFSPSSDDSWESVHGLQLHSRTYQSRGDAIQTPWTPCALPVGTLDLLLTLESTASRPVIYDGRAEARSMHDHEYQFELCSVPTPRWPAWWGDPETSPRPHVQPRFNIQTGCVTLDWFTCAEDGTTSKCVMSEEDVKHALLVMFPW